MKKTITLWTLVIFAAGLVAFYASSHAVPAKSPETSMDQSIRDLKVRVAGLEIQIASLQKQIKSLEGKYPRVLTIPDPSYFPPERIPPGAKQHEVGGIKYWTIPIGPNQ